MATAAQLPYALTIKRGVTFDLPMQIADADGTPLDFTGIELRFQVADNTDPNADCCNDALAIDLSTEDDFPMIDTTPFLMTPAGTSPAIYGNFRLMIPAYAPASDTGNQAGITLTSQIACQDTTFRIVQVTDSGNNDVPDIYDPLVTGRIRIEGL